ncbi:MAG: hypothetical protein KJZ54_01065 [Phycisphaerales bacterium]|nr:hypothetical protein [Phycisphaerales bacterium]
MRTMIVRAMVALAAVTGPAWGQSWESLGPAPASVSGGSAGRISAVACSRVDPDLYYVGAADGGVWRTRDGGLTWTPLTDHLPTTSIGAIALDPHDEQVVYAGSGEANFANHSRYGLGLYKSTDGGETWTVLAAETFAGRCFSRIRIDPTNTQTLYASVARAGGFPTLVAAKGHPGATGPVGVFKSADGGATWTHLTNGLPAVDATDLALDPANPATLYAAIGHIFGDAGNGVYKTTDAGASWAKLGGGGGLPGPIGRVSLAVAPSQPSRVFALLTKPADAAGGGAENIGGFRSDNGGATWTAHGSVNQATYGWYLSVVGVKPDDANVVFYGGLNMRRYVNGVGANVTPPHVDIHAIEFDAAGRLVVGDDGGVHRSDDLGDSYVNLNDGLSTVQFYAGLSLHPTDERWVMGGTQDNGTNRRSDDGVAWATVLGGDGGWTQLDATRPHRVFAEYQGTGNLFRSTNGGNSFSHVGGGISGRNCFLPPYIIDPADADRMLYATHRIHLSTNGGSGWSVLSGDLTDGQGAIRALAIAPSDSSFVYASTNDGRVLASQDGGANFEAVLTGHPGWPRVTRELTVAADDPREVYLATAHFGGPKVRRSRDAGATWEALDGDLPDLPVNVVVVDSSCLLRPLYAGTDAGVYRSMNGGVSWQRYALGMPNVAVIDLVLDRPRGRLVAGTQGRGAWSVPIFEPGDFNTDGGTDTVDVLAYLNAFVSGEPSADLDGDGAVTSLDFLAFLNWWAVGCG